VVSEGTYTHPVAGTVRYWINDVNSASLALAAQGGQFVVTLRFESQGSEVVVAGPPGVVPPALEANNAVVVAALAPAVDRAGHPSYGAVAARVTADYGCQGAIFAAICSALAPVVSAHVNDEVARAVVSALSRQDLRDRVGVAVWSALTSPTGRQQIEQATGARIHRVKGVRVEADAFALDHD
jgi:hypothetical protein